MFSTNHTVVSSSYDTAWATKATTESMMYGFIERPSDRDFRAIYVFLSILKTKRNVGSLLQGQETAGLDEKAGRGWT